MDESPGYSIIPKKFEVSSTKVITTLDTIDGSLDLLSSLSALRSSSEFCDFTFIVDGKEFKVHRNILAARSTGFCEIFQSQLDSATLDVSAEIFEMLLDFIYTAKLPERVKLCDLFMLLKIGEQYEIKMLVKACSKILIGYSRRLPQNALQVYSACHFLKVSRSVLEAACNVLNINYCKGKLDVETIIANMNKISTLVKLKDNADQAMKKYEDHLKLQLLQLKQI